MKRERNITIIYILIYLVAAITIAIHQPLMDTPPSLCNPPDEHSRYMVPLYICEHGTLPTGFEEELFSADCRWTYGFYTLLPYMIQGYAMRFMDVFTDSQLTLLLTARFVNVIFGLLTAIMVLLIARLLFKDPRIKWIFAFCITFLPQSLFLHTYVNPDSLCILSTSLMVYGMILGLQKGFTWKPCFTLTTGIILCALSYYNAYGFILSSILVFLAGFIKINTGNDAGDGKASEKKKVITYQWKQMLIRGAIIAIIVLLFICWSFIRNYMLYDGDFIGLQTKENFVKSFGIARESLQDSGQSLLNMFLKSPFIPKTIISFIATYGSNTIYTWWIVYAFYLILFGLGLVGLCCRKKTIEENEQEKAIKWKKTFFSINMALCIIIPLILMIQYSYTVDYQPQGRYLIPAIIPLIYFICTGLAKLPFVRKLTERSKNLFTMIILCCIIGALMVTVFITALPVYLQYTVLAM